jgi:hypothetical protein
LEDVSVSVDFKRLKLPSCYRQRVVWERLLRKEKRKPFGSAQGKQVPALQAWLATALSIAGDSKKSRGNWFGDGLKRLLQEGVEGFLDLVVEVGRSAEEDAGSFAGAVEKEERWDGGDVAEG